MSDPWQQSRTHAEAAGSMVRLVRERRGISQGAAARELDPDGDIKEITVPNFSRWENGTMIPSSTVGQLIHQWLLQHAEPSEIVTPTPARGSDPETSQKNKPSTSTVVHWAICEVLRMYPDGLPDFHLIPIYNSRSQHDQNTYPPVTEQRLRTARHELVEAGLVYGTERTLMNARGRACTVWRFRVGADR